MQEKEKTKKNVLEETKERKVKDKLFFCLIPNKANHPLAYLKFARPKQSVFFTHNFWKEINFRRRDIQQNGIQQNDTQHKRLNCDSQHKIHSA